ncbi:hypothetical protein PR001_g25336 [Phytophthora rubi]|uniref:Uncharacterized protein n=1 Tax=Phytophthora rubi TaxID=129364 RepID=A0A6A3I4U0_9STRA|nr:hypothetical protein PR001_g25336 [Phytophthora rubi]
MAPVSTRSSAGMSAIVPPEIASNPPTEQITRFPSGTGWLASVSEGSSCLESSGTSTRPGFEDPGGSEGSLTMHT